MVENTVMIITAPGPLTREEQAQFIDEMVEAARRTGKDFDLEVNVPAYLIERISIFNWSTKPRLTDPSVLLQ